MIMFTKIDSFAYLSQLRPFRHWYSDIGDQEIKFEQWLVQQEFDTCIPVFTAKFWSSKNADLPFKLFLETRFELILSEEGQFSPL